MEQIKVGFVQQVRSLPRTFYVANAMEIFERMAWCGMFTPLALYRAACHDILHFSARVLVSLAGQFWQSGDGGLTRPQPES